MIRFENVGKGAAGVVALVMVAPLSAAPLEKNRTTAQVLKQPVADNKSHHLVLQVNTNDPLTMNLALNNATNVTQILH